MRFSPQHLGKWSLLAANNLWKSWRSLCKQAPRSGTTIRGQHLAASPSHSTAMSSNTNSLATYLCLEHDQLVPPHSSTTTALEKKQTESGQHINRHENEIQSDARNQIELIADLHNWSQCVRISSYRQLILSVCGLLTALGRRQTVQSEQLQELTDALSLAKPVCQVWVLSSSSSPKHPPGLAEMQADNTTPSAHTSQILHFTCIF